MTNTEKDLFESILKILDTSRNNLFKNKSKENEEKVPEEKPNQPEKIEEKPKENNKNPNPIVRVIKDVPEFIGTNEKRYNLRKNDILSLPEDMCEMLDRRGVIKKINN